MRIKVGVRVRVRVGGEGAVRRGREGDRKMGIGVTIGEEKGI
jgi:hypothetical protein